MPCPDPDLIIVGCAKLKLKQEMVKARTLYISPLFRFRRAYAERKNRAWMILSAKHGLIDPDHYISTYDLTLFDLTKADIKSLIERIRRRLLPHYIERKDESNFTVEVHAGECYATLVRDAARTMPIITVQTPTQGMGVGQQLHWYKSQGLSV